MIEVAYEILNENNKEAMNFSDIVNDIQSFLGKTDEQIKEHLPQFYTDLNNDGSFLSLGENVWGLRKWYPFDSIDEEVNHPEDNGTENTHKAAQKVNAFLSDDEEDDDVVDYDDDSDLSLSDDDSGESNGPDLSKFTNSDISVDDSDEGDDKEDDLDDGIEGQLTEFDADDDDIDLSDEDDDDEDSDDDDDSDDTDK